MSSQFVSIEARLATLPRMTRDPVRVRNWLKLSETGNVARAGSGGSEVGIAQARKLISPSPSIFEGCFHRDSYTRRSGGLKRADDIKTSGKLVGGVVFKLWGGPILEVNHGQ
jgi:hypothetical protein